MSKRTLYTIAAVAAIIAQIALIVYFAMPHTLHPLAFIIPALVAALAWFVGKDK